MGSSFVLSFIFDRKYRFTFGLFAIAHELHFVSVDPKTKQLRQRRSHAVLKEQVKRSRLHGKLSPFLLKPKCGRVIFEQVLSFPILLRPDCNLGKIFHEANRPMHLIFMTWSLYSKILQHNFKLQPS